MPNSQHRESDASKSLKIADEELTKYIESAASFNPTGDSLSEVLSRLPERLCKISRYPFSLPEFDRGQEGTLLATIGLYASLPMNDRRNFYSLPIFKMEFSRFGGLFTAHNFMNMDIFYPESSHSIIKGVELARFRFVAEDTLNEKYVGTISHFKGASLREVFFSSSPLN